MKPKTFYKGSLFSRTKRHDVPLSPKDFLILSRLGLSGLPITFYVPFKASFLLARSITIKQDELNN